VDGEDDSGGFAADPPGGAREPEEPGTRVADNNHSNRDLRMTYVLAP